MVIAGDGITVTGVGSAGNPFVIGAVTAEIGNLFSVTDTPSLNLTLLGSGSVSDPYSLHGQATLGLSDLTDVADPEGPVAGDVPVWVGGGGGHWEFQPVVVGFVELASLTRTFVSGTVSPAAGAVDGPVVIRYELTNDTEINLPDGTLNRAYLVYFDVVSNGFTFGIPGGTAFAGVETVTRALVPMLWAGDTWFSQWPGA